MKALLALLVAVGLASSVLAETRNPVSFQDLLQESGLRLIVGSEFIETPVKMNGLLAYEHALRHDSGKLEMRFIVRPLKRIEIEYLDPHNAAPEANHLFPLLFESITNRLAIDSESHSNTFSEPEAQRAFNAHWAAISVFDIDPTYAGGYQNALLVALHRNELADAYTLFLYDDYDSVKPLINESLSALSFLPALNP